MSTLDLGALSALVADTDKPARMVVINTVTGMPTLDGEGKECWIDFYSIDSEIGRKLEKQRSMAQIRKLRSGRNRIDDEDFDAIEQQIDALVALAADWSFGGAPFSRENARLLFSHSKLQHIRKQAWGFVSAEANFMQSSSTN